MLCQAYFSVSLIAPADSLMSSGAFLKYRAEHGYIQLHVICIRFRPRNSLFLSHSNPERANRFTVCRQTYIIFENGVWGVAPSGVRAAAPHSAPARTPGVYAQRLYARTHTSGRTKSVQDAPTTNDHDCTDAEPTKHTQPFTGERGSRQGCRNKDTPSFARSKANRVS